MSNPIFRKQVGRWLPDTERARANFRRNLADRVSQRGARVLCSPVQALSDLLHDDPILRMAMTRAIDQAIAAGCQLHYTSIDELMARVDELMTYASPFSTSATVGCPLNALLDWPMCMPAGFELFRSPKLNERMRGVLCHWGMFLSSPESCTWLNDTSPTGWLSAEAKEYIPLDDFQINMDNPHGGFDSWNAFFTRKFKPGRRPVAGEGDPAVVVSAAEATPYNIERGVRLEDAFWMKGQPYSLRDIFTPTRSELAQRFEGGDLYQAFLSAYNYHRWHAPISGKVVHAYNVPGTYYSDVESAGLDNGGPDESQGYLTAVATRAVIVLDSPQLGQVACVFVGMAEVSSCLIGVAEGDEVDKGDELGMFKFGGSTHCLIFEPGVIETFLPQPPFDDTTTVLKLSAPLAKARLRTS